MSLQSREIFLDDGGGQMFRWGDLNFFRWGGTGLDGGGQGLDGGGSPPIPPIVDNPVYI